MDESLLEVAVRAYKSNQALNADSEGLNWLTVPLQRVLDAVEPLIRADEREKVLAEAMAGARIGGEAAMVVTRRATAEQIAQAIEARRDAYIRDEGGISGLASGAVFYTDAAAIAREAGDA